MSGDDRHQEIVVEPLDIAGDVGDRNLKADLIGNRVAGHGRHRGPGHTGQRENRGRKSEADVVQKPSFSPRRSRPAPGTSCIRRNGRAGPFRRATSALQTTNVPPLQSSRRSAYTRQNAAALDRPDAFCKRRVPSRPRNDALHAGEEAPKGLDRANWRCSLRAPMRRPRAHGRRARSRPSMAVGRPVARRRRAPRPSNAPSSRASSTTNARTSRWW